MTASMKAVAKYTTKTTLVVSFYVYSPAFPLPPVHVPPYSTGYTSSTRLSHIQLQLHGVEDCTSWLVRTSLCCVRAAIRAALCVLVLNVTVGEHVWARAVLNLYFI